MTEEEWNKEHVSYLRHKINSLNDTKGTKQMLISGLALSGYMLTHEAINITAFTLIGIVTILASFYSELRNYMLYEDWMEIYKSKKEFKLEEVANIQRKPSIRNIADTAKRAEHLYSFYISLAIIVGIIAIKY